MGLYISVTTASSTTTDSAINEAIIHLAAAVANKTKQGLIPDGPSLDVTFMLPGQLEKPDFTGMRMGGYTTQGDTLFFEKAVPEHILQSTQAPRYVAMVMQDVVVEAESFFREHDMAFDAARWQEVMAQLAEGDVAPPTVQ